MSITKQRLVIIGDSLGMGLALARWFRKGEVVLCGRSSCKLETAVSTLAEQGSAASY